MDVYYLLYGHCCCFCFQGSGVLVFRSSSPMGPWTRQAIGEDLACVANTSINPRSTPGQGCLYGGVNQVSVTHAQQNFVIRVRGADGNETFVWTGDLWQQSPDGLKCEGHAGHHQFLQRWVDRAHAWGVVCVGRWGLIFGVYL